MYSDYYLYMILNQVVICRQILVEIQHIKFVGIRRMGITLFHAERRKSKLYQS
jgi:hypothetical protein